MKLTNNFTLEELTYSKYAEDNGISNLFDATIVNHLLELCENFLQPFREYYRKPIKVSSGFRSDALNEALGGSKTSAHPVGYAADIQPADGNYEEFVKSVLDFVDKKKPAFDQLLKEESKAAKWVHIGLFNRQGKQRKQIKDLKV